MWLDQASSKNHSPLLCRFVFYGQGIVKQPLQFNPCLVDGCPSKVEQETVADHELEVAKELSGIGILTGLNFFIHMVDMFMGFLMIL